VALLALVGGHAIVLLSGLGGRLFAALGALVLVTALLSTTMASWVLGIGLAAVLPATIVYSYVVWRDDPDRASARA